MKKFFIGLLVAIALFCGLCAFSACAKKDSDDEGKMPVGDFKEYTDDIDYRFSVTTEEECPNGYINENDDYLYGGITYLTQGRTYYIVLDCIFHGFGWAEDNFTITTFICDEYSLDATLQEAKTGTMDERVENSIYNISTTYKVPVITEEDPTYRVIYKVQMTDGIVFTANFEIDGLGKSSPFSAGLGGLDVELNPDQSSYTVKSMPEKRAVSYQRLALPTYFDNYPVTAIADGVFKDATKLEKLIIPATVTSIGKGAFGGCHAEIAWGQNSAIERIDEEVFKDYAGSVINIPASVTSVAATAFESCYSIKGVYITDIAAWCEIDFETYECNPLSIAHNLYYNGSPAKDIAVPAEVGEIKKYAFYGCENLESISVPDSVHKIGDSAFAGCSGVESVALPFVGDGLDKSHFGYIFGASQYASNAMNVPDSLKTVEIRGGVIEENAFYGCKNLENVTVGNDVTNICCGAFAGCTGIENISLPFTGSGNNNYNDYHFGYIFGAVTGEYGGWDLSCVPESVKNVTITGKKRIYDFAFYECANIENITICDSVKSIGRGAFEDCASLESISLPFVGDGDDITHFGYVFGTSNSDNQYQYVPKSLKTVVITGGDKIDYSAFRGCEGLESITLPDSVTSIMAWAFNGCASLANINIPEGVKLIGSGAFADCTGLSEITLPEGLTQIERNAFENCYAIEEITIPDSVTSVGEGVLKNCIALSSITLPFMESVTEFGYLFGVKNADVRYNLKNVALTGKSTFSFKGCLYIENVTFTDKLTSIGDNAFENCTGLTEVHILSGVERIGVCAFYGCENLGIVDIVKDSRLTSIGGNAFEGCASLKSISIPDGVTSIGRYAFSGCAALGEIKLPEGDGFDSISEYAFEGCENLKDIIIPDGVTSIGAYAFQNCTSLASVTIGKGVASIADYAFRGCGQLASVNITDIAAWCGIDFGNTGANPLMTAHNLYYNGSPATNLVITGDVSVIKDYAFCGCENIESITIPASVTSIGKWAFYSTRLKEMTLPCAFDYFGYIFGSDSYSYNSTYLPSSLKTVIVSGGESIPQNAFYKCGNIESVTIGGGVKTISADAFAECPELKTVTVCDGVTSIGDNAFDLCKAIIDITIADSVETIGLSVLGGCKNIENITLPFVGNGSDKTYFDYIFGANEADYTYEPNYLKSVVITGGTIGNMAFYSSKLESITLSDGVTLIDECAFLNCSKLKNVVIGDGVTSIGRSAFTGLDNLESVIIGSGVTSIGYRAFWNCGGLKEVTFKNTEGWEIEMNSQPFGLNVDNPANNAAMLSKSYCNYTWTRVSEEE